MNNFWLGENYIVRDIISNDVVETFHFSENAIEFCNEHPTTRFEKITVTHIGEYDEL